MADATLEEMMGKLKDTCLTVSGSGVVLTRERNCEAVEEFPRLIMSQNSGELAGIPQGMLITFIDSTEEDSDAVGCVDIDWNFKIEDMIPFNDAALDDTNSHALFRQRGEALKTAFRANRTLGYAGNVIRHHLLQSDAPLVVRKWSGGEDALLTHYTVWAIKLTQRVKARQ